MLKYLALTVVLVACKSSPPAREQKAAPAVEHVDPTYNGQVAAILEARCASCHAEGGIGPMPLTSFEDAKTHAGAIAFSRTGDPEHGDFQDAQVIAVYGAVDVGALGG